MATTEQQQLDFGPDREAERAERLRRVAQLATLPKVSTASHWFTEEAAREAERRCRAVTEPIGGRVATPTRQQQSERFETPAK